MIVGGGKAIDKLKSRNVLGLLYITSYIFVAALIHSLIPDWKVWTSFYTDITQVWQVGGIYGDGWNSIQFSPFRSQYFFNAEKSIIISVTLATFLFLFYPQVSKLSLQIFKNDLPTLAKLALSFFPGYIFLTFVYRVLTLFFDINFSSKLVYSLSIIFTILNNIKYIKEAHIRIRLNVLIKNNLNYLIIIFMSVVWSLQNGRNHLIPDSTINFMNLLGNEINKETQLPLFSKQSSEYMFALIPYGITGSKEMAVTILWLGQGFMRVTCLILFYQMLRKLNSGNKLDKILNVILLSLVLWGTSAPDPSDFLYVTGGNNQLLINPHIDRMVVLISPLIVYSSIKLGLAGKKFLFFAGIISGGYSIAIQLNNVISILLNTNFEKIKSNKLFNKVLLNLIPIIGLTPILLMIQYKTLEGVGFWQYLMITVAFFLLTYFMINTNRKVEIFTKRGMFIYLTPYLLGVFGSTYIWGGFFLKYYQDFMWGTIPILNKIPSLNYPPLLSHYTTPLEPGIWSSCINVTPICLNWQGYTAFLGMPIFTIVIATFFILKNQKIANFDLLSDLVKFTLCVLLISFPLVYWSGTKDGIWFWISSRLFEVFLFGSIFSQIVIYKNLYGIWRIVVVSLLALTSAITFLNLSIVGQLATNIIYLIRYFT